MVAGLARSKYGGSALLALLLLAGPAWASPKDEQALADATAEIAQAHTAEDANDISKARALLDHSYQTRLRLEGEDSLDVADVLNELSFVAALQRNLAEADAFSLKAYQTVVKTAGDTKTSALAMGRRALFLGNSFRFREAAPLFLQTSSALERISGAGEPLVFYSLLLAVEAERNYDMPAAAKLARETYNRVANNSDALLQARAAWLLAFTLAWSGGYAEAEALARKADTIYTAHSIDDAYAARARLVLATILAAKSRLQEAEPLALKAHADLKKYNVIIGIDATLDNTTTPMILSQLNHHDQAIALAKDNFDRLTKAIGYKTAETMMALETYTRVTQNAHQNAVPIVEKVHEAIRAELGTDNKTAFAIEVLLSSCLAYEGDVGRAEELAKHAYIAFRDADGAGSPTAIWAALNYVQIGFTREHYRDIEPAAATAFAAARKMPSQFRIALVLQSYLAYIMASKGQLDDAERAAREAYEGLRNLAGPTASETVNALSNVALVDAMRGGPEVEVRARQAYAAMEDTFGPDNLQTIFMLNNLVQVMVANGRQVAALSFAETAYRRALKILGPGKPDSLKAQSHYVMLLVTFGQTDEAFRVCQELYHNAKAALGPDDPAIYSTQSYLAVIIAMRGDQATASTMARQAYDWLKAHRGIADGMTAYSLQFLAWINARSNSRQEGERLAREVADSWAKAKGPDSPEALQAKLQLAIFLSGLPGNHGINAIVLDVYQRSRAIYGDHFGLTMAALGSLSWIQTKNKDTQKALQSLTQLLESINARGGEHCPQYIGVQATRGSLLAQVLHDYASGYDALDRAAAGAWSFSATVFDRYAAPGSDDMTGKVDIAHRMLVSGRGIFEAQLDAGWHLAHDSPTESDQ
ncbi:MAG: tetratricopeptide repeat protein [Rhizomicrobium sp.]|nr:tetratricopeptide repeat protein [Rhizomicrobium sp.]